MINYVTGNLLESDESLIGHQVNAQGVMGAGLAKQIRSKYPNVYDDYMTFCKLNPDKNTLMGHTQFIEVGNDKYVASLFGQLYYGRQKMLYTHYPSLKIALTELREVAEEHGLSVGLPFGLGCGLANGSWEIVSKIIEEVFDGYEVTIYKFG